MTLATAYLDGNLGLVAWIVVVGILVVTAIRSHDDRTAGTDDQGVPW